MLWLANQQVRQIRQQPFQQTAQQPAAQQPITQQFRTPQPQPQQQFRPAPPVQQQQQFQQQQFQQFRQPVQQQQVVPFSWLRTLENILLEEKERRYSRVSARSVIFSNVEEMRSARYSDWVTDVFLWQVICLSSAAAALSRGGDAAARQVGRQVPAIANFMGLDF